MPGPDQKTPIESLGEGVATPEPREASRSRTEPETHSETPQAASISSTQLGTPERTRRGPSVLSRAASRLGLSRLSRWVDGGREAPLAEGAGRARRRARKGMTVAGGALAILGAVLLPRLFRQEESAPPSRVSAASMAGAVSGLGGVVDGGAGLFADPRTATELADAGAESADGAAPDAATRPAVWRVAQLASDPTMSIVDVPMARRPLAVALAGTRVPRPEAQRVIASLGEVHNLDRFGAKDDLTLAMDKATGHVVAYELAESPADVWQGRDEAEDGTPTLAVKRLKLEVERVRLRKAVLVGADLHASFVDAGLAPIDDLLAMLDDALDGHAELSDIRPGSRLRIVATQDQVDGAFVRWVSLEAVEYFPASPAAPSIRVYRFGDEDDDATDRTDRNPDNEKRGLEGRDPGTKRRRGWYDARGRQPYHGGWRTPVPLARITSRFNPHRMHPVLHVIMPHNGVDFAAPVGTPVYATAAGVVTSAGNAGPCGNKIEIAHAGNVTSIYCHLSRFAAGLHVGMHVEQRQLIAYVGQTGRVTGPHLHFGIRKNGIIVDPMTLRLDGVRVVPRGQRDEFDRQRAELDVELDAVALPPATSVPVEQPEPTDSFYEEP